MQVMKWSVLALAVTAGTTQLAFASAQSESKGFVEDSSLNLLLRNTYWNRDYNHGQNDRKTWGQAFIGTYESGFTQGTVGVGVDAFGLLGLQKGQVPWRGLKTNDMVGLVLTGVLLAAHYVTFFMGIQVGGVAVGTLGFACFPAFTTLFESIAYRERPSSRELQCLALVTLGLVCTAPSFSLAHDGTAGLLLGVISGLAYALVTIANRRFASHLPILQTTWWQNVVTAAFLLPFTWWQFAEVRALDWLWIACLGLVCSALAYVIFIDSLVVLKALQAALIITLEPVYAILAAWVVLGDVPGLRVIFGGGIILGAVLLLNRR